MCRDLIYMIRQGQENLFTELSTIIRENRTAPIRDATGTPVTSTIADFFAGSSMIPSGVAMAGVVACGFLMAVAEFVVGWLVGAHIAESKKWRYPIGAILVMAWDPDGVGSYALAMVWILVSNILQDVLDAIRGTGSLPQNNKKKQKDKKKKKKKKKKHSDSDSDDDDDDDDSGSDLDDEDSRHKSRKRCEKDQKTDNKKKTLTDLVKGYQDKFVRHVVGKTPGNDRKANAPPPPSSTSSSYLATESSPGYKKWTTR